MPTAAWRTWIGCRSHCSWFNKKCKWNSRKSANCQLSYAKSNLLIANAKSQLKIYTNFHQKLRHKFCCLTNANTQSERKWIFLWHANYEIPNYLPSIKSKHEPNWHYVYALETLNCALTLSLPCSALVSQGLSLSANQMTNKAIYSKLLLKAVNYKWRTFIHMESQIMAHVTAQSEFSENFHSRCSKIDGLRQWTKCLDLDSKITTLIPNSGSSVTAPYCRQSQSVKLPLSAKTSIGTNASHD